MSHSQPLPPSPVPTLLSSFPDQHNPCLEGCIQAPVPTPLLLPFSLLTSRLGFIDKNLTTPFPASRPSVFCGSSWMGLSTLLYALWDSMWASLCLRRHAAWSLPSMKDLSSCPHPPSREALWACSLPLCSWLLNPLVS